MELNMYFDEQFDMLMERLKKKYGEELFDLDGIGKQLDLCQFSKKFFSVSTAADASIDANANVDDTSVIAYHTELPKPLFRLNSYYMLWKKIKKKYSKDLADDIIEKQLCGDFYIHDFHGLASGLAYCFNYSTYDILSNGLPMVKKIKSLGPKYLYAFKSQLEQFVTIASNSTLGAAGLADLLIIMSYYAENIISTKSDAHFSFKSEEDCWTYIKENLVSFIYTINQPMRGNQSPFTNISVYDDFFLKEISKDIIFPNGKRPSLEIVKKLQEIYLDTMNTEMKRTAITFPVTTACFSINSEKDIQDLNFAKFISKKNLDFGFINIYMGDTSTLSSCCRLRSKTVNEFFNSFGAGSSKIGSLGVVTLNFPRIAIMSKTKEKFIENIIEYTKIGSLINDIKRDIVKGKIEAGNLPLYKLGFMDLNKQYSTIGVNGLYDALQYLGMDILSEEGQQFVLKIMENLNKTIDHCQEIYSAPHNCEQVPGENTSIKLAKKDKYLKYQNDRDFYSNQFIPLTADVDMLDRIKLQGLFDSHFSGGSVLHLNVEEQITSIDQLVSLIELCAKKGVVYFSINYNLQECENSHMSVGRKDICGICGGSIVGNFTRVVGFLTKVDHWHKVRREQDYPSRKFYKGVQ